MVTLVAGTVSGTLNNDVVTVDVSNATGTMANDAAGGNKAVTVTGVTLSGAKAGNYTLSAQPTGATVTINKSTPSAPAAPTAASTTKNSITLTAHDGDKYEYGDGAWTTNNVFSGLAPSTAYSFYQSVKETDNTTFDAEAVAAIAEQTKGKDLMLHLDDVKVTELTSAQQDAVKELEVEVVLDAYLTSNGQRISDFDGGKATVSVPYELKEG